MLPQIWGIAQDYQVNLSKDVVDSTRWKQKIEKAPNFRKMFGSASVDTLLFTFDRKVPCLKIKSKGDSSNGDAGVGKSKQKADKVVSIDMSDKRGNDTEIDSTANKLVEDEDTVT